MSQEGSLQAPTRHPIDWRSEEFSDAAKLDAEMRRVFDICHGCRRCFNLCDSFPRLFDLIDSNANENVESLKSDDFARVVEACTLCDMCFMTKCPYVPPHAFDLDFPHLMLRARAVEAKNGKKNFTQSQLAQMDRNGRLARFAAPLVNWASDKHNALTRPLMEKAAGIDRDAKLPKFHAKTFVTADRSEQYVLPPLKRTYLLGRARGWRKRRRAGSSDAIGRCRRTPGRVGAKSPASRRWRSSGRRCGRPLPASRARRPRSCFG